MFESVRAQRCVALLARTCTVVSLSSCTEPSGAVAQHCPRKTQVYVETGGEVLAQYIQVTKLLLEELADDSADCSSRIVNLLCDYSFPSCDDGELRAPCSSDCNCVLKYCQEVWTTLQTWLNRSSEILSSSSSDSYLVFLERLIPDSCTALQKYKGNVTYSDSCENLLQPGPCKFHSRYCSRTAKSLIAKHISFLTINSSYL